MNLMTITGPAMSPVITNEAAVLKESALAHAGLIGAVRNEQENRLAVEVQAELRSISKTIEDARVAVKAPFLDLCRRIDAKAKEFTADIAAEEWRISKLVGDYQQEQLEIQRQAARKAAEEAARIERAKAEEVARLQREVAAAAAAAKSEEDRKRIEAEAEAKVKVLEERKVQELQQVQAAAPAPKADGQVVREVWQYEVSNIWDLVKARPDLVTIEVRKSATNEAIALLAGGGGEPKIPGLRIWKEVRAGVRVGKQPKALEV